MISQFCKSNKDILVLILTLQEHCVKVCNTSKPYPGPDSPKSHLQKATSCSILKKSYQPNAAGKTGLAGRELSYQIIWNRWGYYTVDWLLT